MEIPEFTATGPDSDGEFTLTVPAGAYVLSGGWSLVAVDNPRGYSSILTITNDGEGVELIVSTAGRFDDLHTAAEWAAAARTNVTNDIAHAIKSHYDELADEAWFGLSSTIDRFWVGTRFQRYDPRTLEPVGSKEEIATAHYLDDGIWRVTTTAGNIYQPGADAELFMDADFVPNS